MKIFLFLLILIPMIGISQSNGFHNQMLKANSIDQTNTGRHLLDSQHYTDNINPSKMILPSFTNDNKMLLDSSYQVNFNSASDTTLLIRKYYEYDENENEISLRQYNSCKTCVPVNRKEESAYDQNDNDTLSITYIWDFNIKQWVMSRKFMKTYDDKQVLINYIDNYYNNGTLESSSKYVPSYDEHGKIMLENTSQYDEKTGQWVIVRKDEYDFTSDSINIHIISIWDKETSHWIYLDKTENEYDANGKEVAKKDYKWDRITNQWVGYYMVTYSYAANGKIINVTSFNWDVTTNNWVGSQKTDYSHDIKNLEILKILSMWDTDSNQWIGYSKYENIYNELGLLISPIFYKWNQTAGTWNLSSKGDYEYDQQRNMTKAIISNWVSTNKTWWVRSTYNYYYSLHDLTQGLDLAENQMIKLFPNPAHEDFTLEINDRSITICQLFNSNGQLIQNLPVEHGANSFNISHLKKGLYLIKINSQEGTLVKKILKN